ncbi:hypothetical protein KVT40_003153 [Elsinoe batatas]|uniref:Structural maintenance of chromosomes protein 5 n=1 Tax=Elsinoe batatas TaxID=2601811 RepID=A0A8K0LBP2_9PEZI|nr:hypothetical protein KVT40_003153 [Elsinoe batatas]
MPGRLSGRKRTHSPDSEGDESTSQASEELGSSAKRPRTNAYQSHQSPSRPLLPSSYRNDAHTSQNDISIPDFQPGSVRRVTMRNFVTYKEAEFLPGPSLNMVIGPNGTGKSTLVCAICLGLGWETKHLGRAKDVGEFIRHGCEEAQIVIELERDPQRHDHNQIIKAVIKRKADRNGDKTGKTTFYLNGRESPRKRIIEECKSFAIQVDNLCQFLPQDRVVEFAALNPIELLAKTLQAAAPAEVTDQHEQLKELHADQAKFVQDQRSHTENLKSLESRHSAQRTDVERFQERASLQKKIAALDMFKPTLEFKAARALWEEAKSRRQTARDEMTQLEAEVAPALETCNQKLAYVNQVRVAVQSRKRLATKAEADATRHFQKQEQFATQIKDLQTQQENESKREKDLNHSCQRLRNTIGGIEVKMQNAPPEFDPQTYNDKIREHAREINTLENKIAEVQEKQGDISTQIANRQRQIANLERDKEALQSKAGRQENKLKSLSPDTFRAWQWVQNHQNAFKDQVYGPPMLTCSVKDPRYADSVENAFGKSDFVAFTVTNDEDFQKLQRELAGSQKLSDIYIRTSRTSLASYRPSVPQEQLSSLGLDGYILDLLEGPEPVLGMLCDGRAIHQTAFAKSRLSPEQIDGIQKTELGTFVTPDEIYTTTRRREYGAAGISTRTRKTKKAQVFNDAAVDTSAENEIKRAVLELRDEIADLQVRRGDNEQALKDSKEKMKEHQKQRTEVQTQKDQLQSAVAKFNGLPTQLANEKEKLQAKREELQDLRDRTREYDEQIGVIVMNKGKEIIQYVIRVDALQKMHAKLFEAEIVLIEAESDLQTLEDKNTEVTSRLEQAKANVERAKEDVQEARTNAQYWQGKLREMEERLTDEDRAFHSEIPEGHTAEDLQNDIEGLQARLESLHEGNANVVKEFEERALRIEKTKEKLKRITRDLSILESKISDIRRVWEPKVDALVSQISDAFSDNFNRIGCAGQVEVNKADDFSEWSIMIMVKFRQVIGI